MVKTRGMPIVRGEGQSVSATTTRTYVQRWPWARDVELYSDTAFRFQFAPRLKKVLFYDESADTGVEYTDNTAVVTDRAAGTQMTLNDMAATDRIYVGALKQWNRMYIDIGAANANAAVITVNYYKSDATWADTSATDGTDSGGASMAVDGEIDFTLPTDWISSNVGDAQAGGHDLYWLQILFDAALDAGTDIDEIILGEQNTNHNYNQAGTGRVYVIDEQDGVILLTDSGTATVEVNWHGYRGE